MSQSGINLLDNLLGYAVRFAEMNEEPRNGDCWRTIEEAQAFLASAPAQPIELKEQVMSAIGESLGDAYDCKRVWSAWYVGTMSQDDFTLVADDRNRLADIADAAIAAVESAAALDLLSQPIPSKEPCEQLDNLVSREIVVTVSPDYEPEDGDAFDAVFAALDFAEIPATVVQRKVPRGVELARKFMTELLDSVETLTGVAEEHGIRTLADLTYLQQAIVNGSFVDHYPHDSALVSIVQGLPSGKRWMTFIKVEELDS